MALGQPDPSQSPAGPGGAPPGAGMLPMLISVLAGAGFDKIAGGVNKLGQSGVDPTQIMSVPDLKLLAAGAGIKDVANSMNLISPILQMLMPPEPPEAQKPQIPMQALLPALTAKLGPGRMGLQAGPGAIPPPSMGAPPMGLPPGMGAPPMGLPPMPPPPMMGGI